MPWLALFTAVVTEIIWGLSLKWAPTTSRPLVAALIPIVLSFLNMGLLSYAMRFLPAGLSYALWTGLGSIGVAVGGNETLMTNLPVLGGKALILTVACVAGSLICIVAVRRFFPDAGPRRHAAAGADSEDAGAAMSVRRDREDGEGRA